MASPASTGDIESRWRRLTSAEEEIAGVRLDDAWRKLKRRITDIETRMVGDADLTADVVQVLADSVVRVLASLQRDGVKKGSVSIDDRTRSWEYGDLATIEGLYFTDEELASLLPNVGGYATPRAFSVIPC